MAESETPNGGVSDGEVSDGESADAGQPAREQLLTVRVAEWTDAVVITVGGELDAYTAPRLKAAIDGLFHRVGNRLLVIDLTAVTFLGPSGLSVLAESANQAVHQHGLDQLRVVVDDTRSVIRPIELTGLDDVLVLFHDVDAAVIR